MKSSNPALVTLTSANLERAAGGRNLTAIPASTNLGSAPQSLLGGFSGQLPPDLEKRAVELADAIGAYMDSHAPAATAVLHDAYEHPDAVSSGGVSPHPHCGTMTNAANLNGAHIPGDDPGMPHDVPDHARTQHFADSSAAPAGQWMPTLEAEQAQPQHALVDKHGMLNIPDPSAAPAGQWMATVPANEAPVPFHVEKGSEHLPVTDQATAVVGNWMPTIESNQVAPSEASCPVPPLAPDTQGAATSLVQSILSL